MTHAESRERNAAMRAFVAAGGTRREAAEKFGVEYPHACAILGLTGDSRDRKVSKREKMARLLREKIRAYVEGGKTRTKAAVRFRVSNSTAQVACVGLPIDQRGQASAVDWSSVDWTQQDTAIAENIGLSRERVRQVRKKLGKPPSPYHRQGDIGRWAIDNREKISGMAIKDIHRICPLKTLPVCIYAAMKSNGIPFATRAPILDRIKRDGLRVHCVIIDGCWLWPGRLCLLIAINSRFCGQPGD